VSRKLLYWCPTVGSKLCIDATLCLSVTLQLTRNSATVEKTVNQLCINGLVACYNCNSTYSHIPMQTHTYNLCYSERSTVLHQCHWLGWSETHLKLLITQFLIVINSNLSPVLHRFGMMTFWLTWLDLLPWRCWQLTLTTVNMFIHLAQLATPYGSSEKCV